MFENWILYLLESAVCLMFFYVFYKLFLHKETLFRANRIYLQVTMVISLFLPLTDLFFAPSVTTPVTVFLLDTVIITAQQAETHTRATLASFPWIPTLILAGSATFLFLLGMSIFKIYQLKRKSKIIKTGKITFVVNDKTEHPFTFLHYIFVNSEIYYNKQNEHIIAHEKAHATQQHTIDLLVSGLISAIQWFNPFAWFYREAFREVHEYLADEQVLKQGTDPILYKQSVYQQATGLLPGSFSFFNVSFIKRRFKMMSRMKSPKSNLLKVLVMIPVTALMVFVFACSTENEKMDEAQVIKAPAEPTAVNAPSQEQNEGSEPTFTTVEQMPEYPGGQKELFKYISSNVKYPAEAKEKGISGKVFVQFVVAKTGTIQDVKVLRGVDPLLDQEAMRVIKAMPAWEPGMEKGKPVNVVYQIPIAFALN